jgi:uncharacterized flavoprotein (TIGR03862 family)
MKKTISIIGGGTSALLLASFLDSSKFKVTIYERNKTVGRKFLVAGDGGFNLTHSEDIETFIKRYTPPSFLEKSLRDFNNNDFRQWLDDIGVPTFVGSSKRIYPKEGIKPIEVLTSIQKHLEDKQIQIKNFQTWTGWNNDNALIFNNKEVVKSDIVIFALGGGSWEVTGSKGEWLHTFESKGIKITPLQSSNCAYKINWDTKFISQNEGKPLKNIAITVDGKTQKGEAVITKFGIEGNAIYALSPQIREHLAESNIAKIRIDLKPTLTKEVILEKINNSKIKKITDILKSDLKLSQVQIRLLKTHTSKDVFFDYTKLAYAIKHLQIEITDIAPINEAISTVGGIDLSSVDDNFQLTNLPNQYCIGEMLNWDAPTGGYLIQACASMGGNLARFLNLFTKAII